jgi:hypothetical protein
MFRRQRPNPPNPPPALPPRSPIALKPALPEILAYNYTKGDSSASAQVAPPLVGTPPFEISIYARPDVGPMVVGTCEPTAKLRRRLAAAQLFDCVCDDLDPDVGYAIIIESVDSTGETSPPVAVVPEPLPPVAPTPQPLLSPALAKSPSPSGSTSSPGALPSGSPQPASPSSPGPPSPAAPAPAPNGPAPAPAPAPKGSSPAAALSPNAAAPSPNGESTAPAPTPEEADAPAPAPQPAAAPAPTPEEAAAPAPACALVTEYAAFTPTAFSSPLFAGAISSTSSVAVATSATLGANTPFGAAFGSSSGETYATLRPTLATSTTFLNFTRLPARVGGAYGGFALGDVDAEDVQVTGYDADGAEVPVGALGFQGSFNYRESAGSTNEPTWDSDTGTLAGNAAACKVSPQPAGCPGGDECCDTDGAAAWFKPTRPLSAVRLRAKTLSGLPQYQLWIAAKGCVESPAAASPDASAPAPAPAPLEPDAGRVELELEPGKPLPPDESGAGGYVTPDGWELDGGIVDPEDAPDGGFGSLQVPGVDCVDANEWPAAPAAADPDARRAMQLIPSLGAWDKKSFSASNAAQEAYIQSVFAYLSATEGVNDALLQIFNVDNSAQGAGVHTRVWFSTDAQCQKFAADVRALGAAGSLSPMLPADPFGATALRMVTNGPCHKWKLPAAAAAQADWAPGAAGLVAPADVAEPAGSSLAAPDLPLCPSWIAEEPEVTPGPGEAPRYALQVISSSSSDSKTSFLADAAARARYEAAWAAYFAAQGVTGVKLVIKAVDNSAAGVGVHARLFFDSQRDCKALAVANARTQDPEATWLGANVFADAAFGVVTTRAVTDACKRWELPACSGEYIGSVTNLNSQVDACAP